MPRDQLRDPETGLLITKRQLGNRLRRSVGESKKRRQRDVELYLKHVIQKPLKQWDLEELARGRPRNKNGGFTAGPRITFLSEEIATEVKRRTRTQGLDRIRQHLPIAIQTMADLLDDGDPRIRFLAAKFIIEYTVGEPPSEAERGGTNNALQGMLASALVLPSGLSAHPTIMGEVVEDDDGDSGRSD